MRRIVITGANKGIGLAIVRGALREASDTFVWLGSRSLERGRAALEGLLAEDPSWAERVEVLPLDVASEGSVRRAEQTIAGRLAGSEGLYAVVNNAGVGRSHGMKAVLETNTAGVRRVTEAFLPLLRSPGGRVVNVTSASGPSFVAKCSERWRRFFVDPRTDWPALQALMEKCVAMEGDQGAFAAEGLGDGDPYGLSKACANTYTQHLATEQPELRINACTPGFIETDMTRRYAEAEGKAPAELGMKPPDEGARCPLFLLFGEPEGNGRYYGSDARRSPLDRYRSPGAPAYEGD